MISTAAKIEAILFHEGRPVSIARLTRLIGVEKSDMDTGLDQLEESLSGRGISLLRHQSSVQLVTAAEASSVIEQLYEDTMQGDLSKAASETLALVLYKPGISKSDIDYVRGVNSQFVLRNLLLRGLIKKDRAASKTNVCYQPTADTLRLFGLNSLDQLPAQKELLDGLADAFSITDEPVVQ